jgi:hypothetical protein
MKKTIVFIIVAVIIIGGGFWWWQTSSNMPENSNQTPVSANQWEELLEYNCELSGGSFSDHSCKCPIEEEIGQTQEMMYDKSTGYCQTTHGGPGGDAFAASVGLPYGDYAFYNNIVQNNCKETGGKFLYVCNCPNGKSYDKSTGYCK